MVITIASVDMNNLIGKTDGSLLFDCKSDKKHFAEQTKGHLCVVGMNTYKTLPKDENGVPHLPNRRLLVVTSNCNMYAIEGNEENDNLMFMPKMKALKYVMEHKHEEDIYIIGGGMIYKAFMPFTDKLDITLFLSTYANKYKAEDVVMFPSFDDRFELTFKNNPNMEVHRELNRITNKEVDFVNLVFTKQNTSFIYSKYLAFRAIESNNYKWGV